MKLPFDRQGHWLVDPPVVETMNSIHESALGTKLSTEDRLACLKDVVQGAPQRQRNAVFELEAEGSPEFLEALLGSLEQNSVAVPSVILRFADDPRVRPALAAATRRVPLEQVEGFASALSAAGGAEALPVLRTRFDEARATFAGISEKAYYDHPVARLGTLAQSILRLDTDATDAAQTLVSLFAHPRPMNRQTAVRQAVEVFRRELKTTAMRVLMAGFETLLCSDDAESFLIAAPTLAQDHFDIIYRRCGEMLNDEHNSLRHSVVFALARTPFPFTGRALAVLARWLREDTDPLDVALWVSGLVHDFLPSVTVAGILRRALAAASPSLRHEATCYIERLAPDLARTLLEGALKDEPDPLLEEKMYALLARG